MMPTTSVGDYVILRARNMTPYGKTDAGYAGGVANKTQNFEVTANINLISVCARRFSFLMSKVKI